MNKWIPVFKDGPLPPNRPKGNIETLVFIEGQIDVKNYSDYLQWWTDCKTKSITHWMPLPPPPTRSDNRYPLGTVLKDLQDGEKFVVRCEKSQYDGKFFEKVCDRPHEDGDYSYMCQNEYCRCKQ